jgi:hypothetical protein
MNSINNIRKDKKIFMFLFISYVKLYEGFLFEYPKIVL